MIRINNVIDPPMDKVEYMLFTDPQRWTYTPGSGIEYFSGDGKRNFLGLLFAEDKGYYVWFDQNSQGMWILLATDASLNVLSQELVEFDEDLSVSEGLLCDQATARSAVKYFVETGGKNPSLKWVSDFDLPSGMKWV